MKREEREREEERNKMKRVKRGCQELRGREGEMGRQRSKAVVTLFLSAYRTSIWGTQGRVYLQHLTLYIHIAYYSICTYMLLPSYLNLSNLSHY
jgi:hypothetical protein